MTEDDSDSPTTWEKLRTLTDWAGTVLFLPEDEEAESRYSQTGVECCGDWTGWEAKRFMDETHEAALDKAYAAFMAKPDNVITKD